MISSWFRGLRSPQTADVWPLLQYYAEGLREFWHDQNVTGMLKNYIEVCTRFGIWILFHDQDIPGYFWLKKLCYPQRKTAIFFDLGSNMVLTHTIPTNVSR